MTTYLNYSATPADNNSPPPVGAPEGMYPSAVDDTMREMMSVIRQLGDGVTSSFGGTIDCTQLNANVVSSSTIDGNWITANQGLTAPSFSVTGTINCSTLTANTVSSANIDGDFLYANSRLTAGNIIISSGGAVTPAIPNNGACGTSSLYWNEVVSQNLIQASDPTLKREIRALPECAPLLAAIDPIRFHWRDPGAFGVGEHWGFDASEIAQVMIGAGHEFAGVRWSETGAALLAPSELTALLWKAVQELSARVMALEARTL